MFKYQRHIGDCLEVMRTMPDNSVDSIVTDPPYGLSFMGKKWDYDVPTVEVWRECLRVLKPGGHLLSFAGTRTQHRMACNIEDAGFEIRDMIAWVYGSGFPKSLNIGKAVDKMQGNEREVVGLKHTNYKDGIPGGQGFHNCLGRAGGERQEPEMNTTGTSAWEGWGTALKPALEPITVARKPFKGTVAENVLKWETGGINIDGCRVEFDGSGNLNSKQTTNNLSKVKYFENERRDFKEPIKTYKGGGRFPANFIHDGSEEVTGLFPETKSGARAGGDIYKLGRYEGEKGARGLKFGGSCSGDSGSAARFFYCAKASKADRDGSTHPTVKPTKLMRYLCRLVTPVGGTVLDPFMGSGTTGKAAKLEGFNFIGIELEAEYIKIANARISAAKQELILEF